MYLSSNKDQNQRKFLSLGRTIVLIGGLLAAVLSFYKPKSGLVISVFMGISFSYLVMLLPTRRSQLIAMLGLAVGAGLIPTLILWTLCYVFQSTTSCQINLLRAQTFGFFAFPSIFMLFSWVTTLFYKPTR
jgi:MFS family permease